MDNSAFWTTPRPSAFHWQQTAAFTVSYESLVTRQCYRIRCNRNDDEEVISSTDASRRAFLSWGSAAATSASMLGLNAAGAGAAQEASAAATVLDSPDEMNVQQQETTLVNIGSQEVIPFSSVRRYKTLVLPQNKLRVLLVHDGNALQASAALTVADAGQFADPDDLPGAAHLMEHLILSYCNKNTGSQTRSRTSLFSTPLSSPPRDFEDWLSNDAVEGASNGFTGYDKVCFHFTCKSDAIGDALLRFAELFYQRNVEQVCSDKSVLQREVLRVDSELDFSLASTQAYYLLKDFVSDEHPFSRFSSGNLETLETLPDKAGINVGERMFEFFLSKYLATKAVLVVIGPQDLLTLERKVAPFAKAFSNASLPSPAPLVASKIYPGGFLRGNRPKQLVLFRKRNDEGEKLSFHFALNLDYRERGRPVVTATQIGFVLAQIFGRRGPGSLYAFLLRRGWVPQLASSIPRISLAMDVSGFQIIRLDIPLTLDGFINRSAIVAAVYNLLHAVQSRTIISRALITQYANIAKLNGYLFAPRPPDAIELAVDAQFFGAERLASGQWCRLPGDRYGVDALQRETLKVLSELTDPDNAIIIASAGSKALVGFGFSDEKPLVLPSPRWLTEPRTGARFCFDDMFKFASRLEVFLLRRIVDEQELELPVLNPLVPATLRQPRLTPPLSKNMNDLPTSDGNWFVLNTASYQLTGRLWPRGPPEPSCRSVFVLELLSSRPVRASIRQAAQAELWRYSFDNAVSDLAELGSFSGLAYDLSFNKFGLRIAFLGVSQTLPSYARRVCRRLVEHHNKLFDGREFFATEIIQKATRDAKSLQGVSTLRRRRYISNLRRTTAYEAAVEGMAFLRSCTGAVCFSEGDLLPYDTFELLKDLKQILAPVDKNDRALSFSKIPEIRDLSYRPQWKPRSASPCAVPGVILVNDACGRIPR
ncbi:hypothetical protein MPSEU_001012400 [Mayamaea pseudoterrestris]|nr:hypothetical protein MPSEU_001012400 [Mayamaea pseudoterrestris]